MQVVHFFCTQFRNFWHITRFSINKHRSIVTMRLSSTVTELWRLNDNGVTNLTFWGHVTSLVTWLFDSRWSTSYGWSI